MPRHIQTQTIDAVEILTAIQSARHNLVYLKGLCEKTDALLPGGQFYTNILTSINGKLDRAESEVKKGCY